MVQGSAPRRTANTVKSSTRRAAVISNRWTKIPKSAGPSWRPSGSELELTAQREKDKEDGARQRAEQNREYREKLTPRKGRDAKALDEETETRRAELEAQRIKDKEDGARQRAEENRKHREKLNTSSGRDLKSLDDKTGSTGRN
eukprot:TRINITY_DN261_c0_g1_i7.p2 TRINITY_DN261_c0_g1~~TRINITY_DN261_c0_g1_i7.p2  ORF type:complete len:144 (+),score=20.69 TRINITY_DN261_c0_g1_i7:53-484(+)